MPILNPIDDKKFSAFTEAMLRKLPYWFSIKKHSQKSIGAAFLNTIGIELENLNFIIEYAFKQCFIDYTDIEQIDIVYKAFLNKDWNMDNITEVRTSIGYLDKAESLPIFNGSEIEKLKNQTTNDKSYYFIDKEKNILYVHEPYDKNNKYPDGKVTVTYNSKKYPVKLSMHHVWNFFDEFGFLLDCPRLYGEHNFNYKTRILDVFKNVANSGKTGLINGIARELNLRKVIVWEDGFKDLIIEDSMIPVNRIKINDKYIDPSEVYINEKKQIVLKGNEKYKKISRIVSYVCGIEMHQLHNKKDIKLYNELYNADGSATKNLIYYTNKLSDICKIEWDKFIWNESYYDINNYDVGSLGFIPSFYDGKISGFKEYNNNRLEVK